ncbi:3-hydroxyacyl-ACP dehydratase FabZ family protein [Flagellimonas sp. S3867]|uniref:3-hydroxyacyl-ACP dehydratase FabZ family protein n=1 Tax=Flagellimonas sp. S3867 TaxID=2768063 RepID=UPI001CC247B9|nr:FabA/FabZ family ACP-dehydratase [Flagellimonas sp. S3867]
MVDKNKILSRLPYSKPFHFVDELSHVDENSVEGTYTFKETLDFYTGHFKDKPVTPGVILTECCAQIGLVCMGIHLLNQTLGQDDNKEELQIGMSSSEMEFYLPVFPGETIKVVAEKEYFRFNKLKCKVKMFNAEQKLVCKGILAGMIKAEAHGK